MTRTDLERMRALVRARHSLPDPPRPVAPATAPPVQTFQPTPDARAHAPSADAPGEDVLPAPARARRTFGRAARARTAAGEPADAVAGGAAAPPWTPDAALHRLVELVIEMKALADPASPRSPLSAPLTAGAESRTA